MKNNFVLVWIVLIGGGSALIWLALGGQPGVKNLDQFAQCLASKGIAMYGSESCPYCQKEKQDFGSAFQYIPYVECPENIQQCLDAGIDGYPTWIFSNGTRLKGRQGLERLSAASGCPLN